MATVLLVDDHPVVREGLRGMIDAEHDLTVVGEAGSGAEAIALAESPRCHSHGSANARRRRGDGDRADRCGAAAHADRRRHHVRVRQRHPARGGSGRSGYLLKNASRAELADAVRDAARGKTVLAPTVADRPVHFVRQSTSVALSAREVEVPSQVAKGSTNAEIGRLLHINKLGVSDRPAAVTTAMSLGLLS
jgi:DNA-binding NarL/FixJ family response regulator